MSKKSNQKAESGVTEARQQLVEEVKKAAEVLGAVSGISSYIANECNEEAVIEDGLVGLAFVTRGLCKQLNEIAQKATNDATEKPASGTEQNVA